MKTNEQIAGECAWCGGALNETVHGIGSSDSESAETTEVFVAVPLSRSSRELFAAPTRRGSRPYNEGYRLIFATCSDDCALNLNDSLGMEEGRFTKRALLKPSEE